MARFRIRFPTTSTADIIRRARAALPREDRTHRGGPACPCRGCRLAEEFAESDALDQAQGLEDEVRAAEEGHP